MKAFLALFRWIFHYGLHYSEYEKSIRSFFSIKEADFDQYKKDKGLIQ